MGATLEGDWKKALENLGDEIPEIGNRALKAIAIDLWRRVTKRSPVDTGRFRSSWNLAVNTPDLTVTEEVKDIQKRETEAAKAEGRRRKTLKRVRLKALPKLGRIKKGDAIFVTNNLAYAVALEEGHSDQAPLGVLKLAVAETQIAAPFIAEKFAKGGSPGGGA